jgi:hypothetical protein
MARYATFLGMEAQIWGFSPAGGLFASHTSVEGKILLG